LRRIAALPAHRPAQPNLVDDASRQATTKPVDSNKLLVYRISRH
jgi:hypothetical protein